MKIFTLLLLGSLLLSDPVNSQIVVKEPLSIRQTYYKIDPKLDTVSNVINAAGFTGIGGNEIIAGYSPVTVGGVFLLFIISQLLFGWKIFLKLMR